MIRQAKISDFNDICRICTDDLGYPCAPELVKERLESLDQSRECVFVFDVDGKAVGFVHVEKFNVLYYKSMANIQGLAVSKAYRKRGIGKSLMQAAENWAKENGIEAVRLNSGATRTEAHPFYRNIGYDNEKTQIRFIKEL